MDKSDLIYAVTDGAEGTAAVTLPADRLEALELKREHDGRFWCSSKAGGCSDQLTLKAGPIRRPYFSHQGSGRCSFRSDPDSASRGYEHLEIQNQLKDWLADQGLEARLEASFGKDGRADLRVVVDSIAHVIEVQLSPISTAAWTSRTENYERHADDVTWLSGPRAEGLATAHIARDGYALLIKPGVEVGVVTVTTTVWVPLESCRLMRHGISGPGLDEARTAAIQEAQARRAAREAEEAERARLALQAQLVKDERAARLAELRDSLGRREYGPEPPSATTPVTPREAPGARTSRVACLEDDPDRWDAVFPEARFWQPRQGWAWLDELPPEVHRAARAAAYTAQVLIASATIEKLLPTVVDSTMRSRILAVMQSAGLVEACDTSSGLSRWRRT